MASRNPKFELVDIATDLARERLENAKHPVDGGGGPPYDGKMEARVAKLEKLAEESQKDLRSFDVRLAKIESTLVSIEKNVATKTDIADIRTALSNIENFARNSASNVELQGVKTLVSEVETRTLRWFLGVVLAMGGLGFAAARFFGS